MANNRKTSLHRELPKRIGTRDVDQLMFLQIDTWYSGFTDLFVRDMLYREEHSVNWHCFECKCPIRIDMRLTSEIKPQQMYCEKHRPQAMTELHYADISLIRYMNAFHSSLRQRIIENSNLQSLYNR